MIDMNGAQWSPMGLNERFRVNRYRSHQRFGRHFDVHFERNENEMSWLSIILYLNETPEFQGGKTTFWSEDEKTTSQVNPQCGSALLFFHGKHALSPLHEGSVVVTGSKYILRSDIMYKRADGFNLKRKLVRYFRAPSTGSAS